MHRNIFFCIQMYSVRIKEKTVQKYPLFTVVLCRITSYYFGNFFVSKKDIWTVKKMSFSAKFIAKMFNLKLILVRECILELVCFCDSCWESGICFRVGIFVKNSLNRLLFVWLVWLAFTFFNYNALSRYGNYSD